MSQESQEEKQKFTFEYTDMPNAHVEAKIEATPEACLEFWQDAVKEVNKKVSIPGFRKGKAPAKLIEEQFSSSIRQACGEILAEQAVQVLVKESPREVVQRERPKIEISKLGQDGSSLKITYAAMPLSPDSLDLSEFSPEVSEVKQVTDTDVDHEINMVRRFRATYKKAEDRPIHEGDRVVVEMTALGDTPRVVYQNRPILMSKDIAPWLYQALLGKNREDVFEVERQGEIKESEEDGALVELSRVLNEVNHFQIKVLEIEDGILPEVDDHFARLHGAESITVMRERMKERLEKQQQEVRRDDLRQQLSHYLLDRYPLEIPQAVKQEEIQFSVYALVEDLMGRGFAPTWIEAFKETVMKAALDKARMFLELYLILKKGMTDKQLTLSSQEVEHAMMIEQLFPFSQRVTVPQMSPEMKMRRLASILFIEKMLDALLTDKGLLENEPSESNEKATVTET